MFERLKKAREAIWKKNDIEGLAKVLSAKLSKRLVSWEFPLQAVASTSWATWTIPTTPEGLALRDVRNSLDNIEFKYQWQRFQNALRILIFNK